MRDGYVHALLWAFAVCSAHSDEIEFINQKSKSKKEHLSCGMKYQKTLRGGDAHIVAAIFRRSQLTAPFSAW